MKNAIIISSNNKSDPKNDPLFKNKNVKVYDLFLLSQLASRCSICMQDYKSPSMIKDCNHVFCDVCIKNWLARSSNCPLCKRNVKSLIRVNNA